MYKFIQNECVHFIKPAGYQRNNNENKFKTH